MLLVAHRGVPAHRLEHTRGSYELAIAAGADFIEPDVVCSADGHLVVRHENEIGSTTDVADHPSLAGGAGPRSSTVSSRPDGSPRT